jgi:hypothetical protein
LNPRPAGSIRSIRSSRIAMPYRCSSSRGEPAQLGRRCAVAREEALDVGRGRVARRRHVEQHDAAARSPEHQRGGESRGASADDRDVEHARLWHA